MALKQLPNLNKVKYKKFHKQNNFFLRQHEMKTFFLMKGEYGIQAVESAKLSYRQIESCRRALRRGLGKNSNIYINLSMSTSVTKKPVGARMGKGKGGISHWVAPVKCGKILFEILSDNTNSLKIYYVLKKVQSKLPIKTKIIKLYY